MARDQTGRNVTGDADDVPAFVTDTKPVPTCVRCHEPDPDATVLHSLCRRCIAKEQAQPFAPESPTVPMQATSAQDLLLRLAERFSVAAADSAKPETVKDRRIRTHAERLMARGLSTSAAWRQAEGMLQDPTHLERCAACRILA